MFHPDEIEIRTAKMSSNPDSKILWIEIGEINVRRLYHRMKTLRNPTVQLINYIPPTLWVKKKKLDLKLKAEKNKRPNFRYIVKLGMSDLLLLTKINGETYWEEDYIPKYLEEQELDQDLNRKRKQSPQNKPFPKRTQH